MITIRGIEVESAACTVVEFNRAVIHSSGGSIGRLGAGVGSTVVRQTVDGVGSVR